MRCATQRAGHDGRIYVLFVTALLLEWQSTPISANKLRHLCGRGSYYVFDHYEPTAWETKWLKNADQSEYLVETCKCLEKDRDLVDAWMTNSSNAYGQPTAAVYSTFNSEVWSKLVYKDVCSANGSKRSISVWMEPVVGLLRNPYFVCFGSKVTDVENRDFLALPGTPLPSLHKLYHGKQYLFDLGANKFESSLSWLIDTYEANGIRFDQIYAWEAQIEEPNEYWRAVSHNAAARLHWYNIFVTKDLWAPGQPFQVLQAVFQPGDYVVLKLDVDNTELEQHILDLIKKDPHLRHMIGAMFTEAHYKGMRIMEERHAWNNPEMVTYKHSVHMIQEYRMLGIPLHFWP